MERVFGTVGALFDTFALAPVNFHDAGDVVVVEGRVGKARSDARSTLPPAGCGRFATERPSAT